MKPLLRKQLLYKGVWLVLAVFIAGLLLSNFRLVVAQGTSMLPDYPQGTLILCARCEEPKTNSVILFEKDGKLILKRLIAKAGQLVKVDPETGDVWVDGHLRADGFAAPGELDKPPFAPPNGSLEEGFIIPGGYIFVLGDNRKNSLDSRYEDVGLISIDSVWGIAIWN